MLLSFLPAHRIDHVEVLIRAQLFVQAEFAGDITDPSADLDPFILAVQAEDVGFAGGGSDDV